MAKTIKTNITNIYDYITHNKDFHEIKHWLLNTTIGQNENFIASTYELNNVIKTVRKDLNALSEATEELDRTITECKKLIQLEAEKDKNFKKCYDKYYRKKIFK